jgi:hypothetical protein
MTVHHHAEAFASGTPPEPAELQGSWRLDTISTAGHLGSLAWLHFESAPDGSGSAHFELMGIAEGLVTPQFLMDHFQAKDSAALRREIRKSGDGKMVGQFSTALSPEMNALFGADSIGLFHAGPDERHTFYYVLERSNEERLRNTILSPFLEASVPPGIRVTFDEMMEGWYWPGQPEPELGREGDLSIAERVPRAGDPPGTVSCSFRANVSTDDINRFIDGSEHQAVMTGYITFGRFEGQSPATFMFEDGSRFQYQRLNPATGEAEMTYHIMFSARGRKFLLEGVKYMQKDVGAGPQTIDEVLNDYTTVFCRVYDVLPAGNRNVMGIGYLKFRTFENLATVGNLPGFLRSFEVSGSDDPRVRFHAQMRFLAFTAPYVQRKYQAAAGS